MALLEGLGLASLDSFHLEPVENILFYLLPALFYLKGADGMLLYEVFIVFLSEAGKCYT